MFQGDGYHSTCPTVSECTVVAAEQETDRLILIFENGRLGLSAVVEKSLFIAVQRVAAAGRRCTVDRGTGTNGLAVGPRVTAVTASWLHRRLTRVHPCLGPRPSALSSLLCTHHQLAPIFWFLLPDALSPRNRQVIQPPLASKHGWPNRKTMHRLVACFCSPRCLG